MAITVTDQVTYPSGLTVTTGGVTAAYTYGAVLPVATTAADVATRAALRAGGVLQLVTVASTPTDLATIAYAAAVGASSSDGDALPTLDGSGAMPVVANY